LKPLSCNGNIVNHVEAPFLLTKLKSQATAAKVDTLKENQILSREQ